MSYVTNARRLLTEVSLSLLAFTESLDEIKRLASTSQDPPMTNSPQNRFVCELPEAIRALRQQREDTRPWMLRVEDDGGPTAAAALEMGCAPQ